MNTEKKHLLHFTFITTFIIGMIAHGYCYFNLLFSHDSMMVYQNDSTWQISLGRFLHPLYFKLRGPIYAPSLVGFISLFSLALTFYLLFQLFHVTSRLSICIISGILLTNTSLTLLNATYIHDIDMYALSLFFAVLSVYLCRHYKYGIAPGILCLCCSLGFYQSYFQVAVFLFMMLAVMDILHKKTFLQTIIHGIRGIFTLLGGLILYYIVLKVVLHLSGISLSNEYNSISGVGHYDSVSSILKYIKDTYLYVFKYFRKPIIYQAPLIRVINLLVLLSAIFLIFFIVQSRKIALQNILLLIVLILLMPFGINVIYFISKGVVHYLMIYSFFLVYVLVQILFDDFCSLPEIAAFLKKHKANWTCIIKYSIPVLLGIFIFNSTIFANQAYVKKDLELKTTMLTINRIIDRIEQTDGYIMEETPVVIVGTLMDSNYEQKRKGLKLRGTGLNHTFSVTDTNSYLEFFHYFLSYPIHLLKPHASKVWAKREDVQNMPVFPAKDSIQLIENTLVVKLS